VDEPRYKNVEYRAYNIEQKDSGEVELVRLPELSKDIPTQHD
jgi:hypothetical protein